MNTRIGLTLSLAAGLLLALACAADRPAKTEIYTENTYLPKDFLTRANPGHVATEASPEDRGWLMGVTVTATSVPTAITDIFPGLQSDTKYVQFVFTQDTVQIVDGITPGPYGSDGNLPDPSVAQDLAPRVLQEYPGTHVDIQLRKSLDGEITNYTEENRERDWPLRQYFKADLKAGKASDLSKVMWYYDWAVSPAMQLLSTAIVPDSYHFVDTVAHESNMGPEEAVDWARGDYLEWTVRATYKVLPFYGSLMVWANNVDTQTVDLKYSLWRRPDPAAGAEYVTRPVGEKDPYRRQFGIWDYVLQNYQDPDSGFVGATALLSRYNPRQNIDFYLVDVPAEFVDVYDSIEENTNALFTQMGVDARIAFHAQDEGGLPHRIGDLRYSFVSWHNNAFTDIPWLGYGPSWMDPRTGEIVNAVLNFNNWQGLHWYTQIVRDLLEQTSDSFEAGAGACTPGELRPILPDRVKGSVEGSTLFAKMESYMGQDSDDWVVEHDTSWYDQYHMLLNDIRWYYPPYQPFVESPRESVMSGLKAEREQLMNADGTFWDVASRLDNPASPTGHDDFTAPGAIEAGVDFLNVARQSMHDHLKLQADRRIAAGTHGICLVDGEGLLASVADIAQRCKDDGTWQTFEEWENEIRWRIAHQTSTHELGHNLGLYHNFYASVDKPNYQTCTGCIGQTHGNSSSVMDYVHHFGEVNSDLGWYPYDKAALTYAYRYDTQDDVNKEEDAAIIRLVHPEWHDDAKDDPTEAGGPEGVKHPERGYLYANDYHEPLSPLVKTFDLGTTPTQMVKNAILYYDWMYKFRNFRSYRQYWETWYYPDSAFYNTFPLRRLLELWAMDWTGDDLENKLRLLGVTGDRFFFDNVRDEFAKEMGQANRMVINFFRAILTQSNAERSYMTTYDPFFGDVTRIGIIYDKFYAMLSFLGLWPADWYNWDDYAYLAYYEGSRGDAACYSDSLYAVKEMLGGSYDVYPWFLPMAALVFAQDTHDINFGDQSMKEWMGFRAFDRLDDLIGYFGFDPRSQCPSSDGTLVDNCATSALSAQGDGHQTFYDAEGGQWIYLYLDDRDQHLAVSADQSPISYKMLWDYNESVNIKHSDTATTYDIKYFLDYYRYFN
jgi:hypothetical protein